MKYSTCIEGYNPQTYNSEYTLDELIGLAQYAITVKFLPSTDIPGQNETVAYSVMADLCSNPVYALNNGYTMSYKVDENSSPPVVTGYTDTGYWIGNNSYTLMWNGCYGSLGSGAVPPTLQSGYTYHACGNGNGIHIVTVNGYSNGCWWDWLDYVGHDITVWLGFDVNQRLFCSSFGGEYKLMDPADGMQIICSILCPYVNMLVIFIFNLLCCHCR